MDNDILIFNNGRLNRAYPSEPFSKVKFLFSHIAVFRTWILNLFGPIPINDNIDDMSIHEFYRKTVKYHNEDDAKYMIEVYEESKQIPSYAGNIKELSARTCAPYSSDFRAQVLKTPREASSISYPKFSEFSKIMKESGYNFFNFENGLENFMEN